ncbi:MAG: carboxypeptidase regulatory-like domain-containing protein [Clostridiales bacterium]|nr:carboxypeptidase regulatory-like domain-containing protein [Clostridiales bacterium]
MRKITSLLLMLLLLFGMSTTAYAADVSISTAVPDSHTLTVTADHAQVFCQGQAGGRFEIGRLSEPTLLIRPENGYRVSKVTLNGEDITASVIGGYYTLEPVYEDKTLTVEAEVSPAATNSMHDISGTVADEDGSPIPGAAVDIGGHTGVTDKNGNFTVEAVPDGYYPVTITGKDGGILGYTAIEITEGEPGVTKNPDGTYMITAPKNSAIHLKLTVTQDGRITMDDVADITPPHPNDDSRSPQTGDNSNITLWLALMAASCAALIGTAVYNRKRRNVSSK